MSSNLLCSSGESANPRFLARDIPGHSDDVNLDEVEPAAALPRVIGGPGVDFT